MGSKSLFLTAILAISLTTVIGYAYYRYFIERDYLVSYEAPCDPGTESCFTYCNDDECTEPEYYKIMHRHAADLYAVCGPNVTDCKEASTCLASDRACEMEFCTPDPADEEVVCEGPTEDESTNDDSLEPSEEPEESEKSLNEGSVPVSDET